MRKRITEYSLYRWRYVIGYLFVTLAVGGVLLFTALFIPGGLREAERSSAVASGALAYAQFDPMTVVNLPYYILQRAGFALFDVSGLTIKLPSIILAVLAIVAMFLLIREWFRANTALISTIITATSPLFLFVAQDGTPIILAVALSLWLLVTGTFITRRRPFSTLWKIMFCILFALNLYVPLGIYLNLAIITTMIFHPHIRYRARRLNFNKVAVGLVVSVVALTPLAYSLATHPSLVYDLIGIPPTMPDIKANVMQLGAMAFGFHQAGSSYILQPVFGLGVLIVILIGVWKFIQIKYTARSYITWFWALTLLPLLVFHPEHIGYIIPLMLMMTAMGIGSIISSWYKMFPLNPYARIAGLVPLTFIVVGLVSSNVARYGVSYHYIPEITRHFNHDIRILDKAIVSAGTYTKNKVPVVVNDSDKPFYDLLARYDERFTVSTSTATPTPYIIAGSHPHRTPNDDRLVLVFTDRMQTGADRFYLYTSPQQ